MSEWKATYSQNYEDIADGLRVQKPGETFLPSEMAQAIEDVNNDISAAYTACENKGATLPAAQVSANLAGTINSIPADGGTTADFYDFAGNLVRSCTADEIAALSELPDAPVIEGFTFQEWNWTLSGIKSWAAAAESGHLCVGGVYVTADGHTRIRMKFTEPRMSVVAMPFCIQQIAGTVLIDWGDNSAPETITAAGIYYHTWNLNTYPADVVIDIQYTPSGTTKLVLGHAVGSTVYGLFNNDPLYAKCVQAVELGDNIDFLLYSGTFKNCQDLKKINLPASVGVFSDRLLNGCDNLDFVVVPSGVTSIGSNTFAGCTNLSLTSLPSGVTSIGNNAFQNCTTLYIVDLTAFTNPTAIPTLSNANAFLGIPAQARFIVANAEMLAAFSNATNWNTFAARYEVEP